MDPATETRRSSCIQGGLRPLPLPLLCYGTSLFEQGRLGERCDPGTLRHSLDKTRGAESVQISGRVPAHDSSESAAQSSSRPEAGVLGSNRRIFERVEGGDPADREIHQKDVNELYYRSLRLLPTRRREVVELKASGMSNEDIARQLLISKNTVKVHYYHGSRFIREFIHRHRDVITISLLSLGYSLF